MARKLLLADDSITIQKVVELVLSEEDYQIKAVNNGSEALNQVESFNPDIVLADIEMPEVNGYQLCEQIKKGAATSGIPVVLLAGAFEPLDEELARNVGADDFIIKPFESQELINKINAVIAAAGGGEAVKAAPMPAVEEAGFAETTEVVEEIEPEAMQVAEAAAEDLWEMEGEPVAAEAQDVWEIEEGEAVTAVEAEAEVVITNEVPSAAGEVGAVSEETSGAAFALPPVHPEMKGPPTSPVSETAGKIAMPSGEEVAGMVRDAINAQVAAALSAIDMKGLVAAAVGPAVKETIEKVLPDLVPDLMKSGLQDILKGSFSSINRQIESVIWETVPDLAENIIKKEVEKIKSEF